jgi:hypothetical protein
MIDPRMIRSLFRNAKRSLDLWLVFGAGVLLNLHYFLSTNYQTRAYDLGGHLEYLAHVFETWTVPAASMGWEMHQAPLYYFVGALWLKAEQLMGVASQDAWNRLQLLSFALSLVTLIATTIAAKIIFPRTQDQTRAAVMLGIVATLPGVVFMSARITNDALTVPLSFLFVASLLAWWKTPTDRLWYVCVGVLIAALLTKLTMVPLGLVLLICLAQHPELKKSKKKSLAKTSIIVIAILAGWLPIVRLLEGFLVKLVTPGNEGLNGLLVFSKYRIGDFISFSPVRILQLTYNDTWSDALGRQYFWEFLFRSAYFGEYRFTEKLQWMHRIILMGGLYVLFAAAYGVWRDWKKKGLFRVPLLTTFLVGTLSLMTNRLIHNSASAQDFRFIVFVCLPVAAYAAMGTDWLPKRFRWFGYAALVVYAIFCAAFLLSLSFQK